MKTKSILTMCGLLLQAFFIGVFAQTNIYNSNGTLTANRTVSLGGYSLNFSPTTANSQLFMNGTNGNIGLGTSSPSFKFQMASGDLKLDNGRMLVGSTFSTWNETSATWGIKSSNGIVVNGANAVTPTIDIYSTQNGNLLQMAMVNCNGCYSNNAVQNDLVFRGVTSGSLIITNEGNGSLKFATKESNSVLAKVQMMIDRFGNIGIGTGSSPLASNEKLAVNGLIHAKEVKVDLLGWPDYVFAADYQLPTLQEVEQSIVAQGHLPNVPSASEIEANGLELGALTKIQQEKIEELTLYLIEQNKVNEQQATQIEELKAMVQQLIDKAR